MSYLDNLDYLHKLLGMSIILLVLVSLMRFPYKERINDFLDFFWIFPLRHIWILFIFIFLLILGMRLEGILSITVNFITLLLFLLFIKFLIKSYQSTALKAKQKLVDFEKNIDLKIRKEMSFINDSSSLEEYVQIFKFPIDVKYSLLGNNRTEDSIVRIRKLEYLGIHREYFSICQKVAEFNLLYSKRALSSDVGECYEYYYSQVNNIKYDSKNNQLILSFSHRDDIKFFVEKNNPNIEFIMNFFLDRISSSLILSLRSSPTYEKMISVHEKLNKMHKWSASLLNSVNLRQQDFDDTLRFYKTSSIEEKTKIFCNKIEASYTQENQFYRIYLPTSFNLNMDTFLLYICNDWNQTIKEKLMEQHDKILIIGKNKEQQKKIYKDAKDKTNKLITFNGETKAERIKRIEEKLNQLLLKINDFKEKKRFSREFFSKELRTTTGNFYQEEELTNLLLNNHSQNILIEIFLDCLLLKDISPYQVNSGVTNESNFFGRLEIIRDIVSKENANYLIVGARQLGKSSIIKALERRYEESSKVDCYSFTMENENIIAEMALALKLAVDASLDDIVTKLSRAKKKSIFLIDEADKFVKNEKENDYRITEVFRKLSQEGKATFVLTGFWTLYFAVTSDYHSPLKNFGELIKLEGLDEESCKALMTEPMNQIGVSYENESIMDNVIRLCGKRPNLIAITCNEVLKTLEGKVITQKDIDEVIENSSLEDYLKGWGSMSRNAKENQLDRVIIYLTLEKESFRLADVVNMLKKRGLELHVNSINSSLERLVVGYLLQESKKNYSYRVPLFKKKLLEDDIEILLDGDLAGLR